MAISPILIVLSNEEVDLSGLCRWTLVARFWSLGFPMHLVITAVGPDHIRLADPIIHYVTGEGANIAEIQMYDHDEEALFAMLLRVELPAERFDDVPQAMQE